MHAAGPSQELWACSSCAPLTWRQRSRASHRNQSSSLRILRGTGFGSASAEGGSRCEEGEGGQRYLSLSRDLATQRLCFANLVFRVDTVNIEWQNLSTVRPWYGLNWPFC